MSDELIEEEMYAAPRMAPEDVRAAHAALAALETDQ